MPVIRDSFLVDLSTSVKYSVQQCYIQICSLILTLLSWNCFVLCAMYSTVGRFGIVAVNNWLLQQQASAGRRLSGKHYYACML